MIEEVFKGLFGAITLWLLSKKPMYGYELMKSLSHIIESKLGPSIVYTLLYRLEDAKLIRGSWKNVGKRRKVRYYTITSKGLKTLEQVKSKLSKRLREFIEEVVQEIKINH